ncbi:hypothetical protein JMF89_13265 [Clostridiaceae bacterium UIB06]|nr:hypothetical protein [Clostridiaceae bacterium UIB06]
MFCRIQYIFYLKFTIEDVMKRFKKKEKSTLDSSTILKVMDLFNNKSWSIDDSTNVMSRFNRFCYMLDKLNQDERELILELSKRYITVDWGQYLGKMEEALEMIYSDSTLGVNEESLLYIMPLIAPKDIGKIKSSTCMVYLLQGNNFNYNEKIYPENFRITEKKDGLPPDISSKKKNQFIILVDDFIGTGETAEECLRDLFRKVPIREKIIVLSLVAQKNGIDKIEKLGVRVFSPMVVGKGITDYYSTTEVEQKKQVMRQIEERIKPNLVHRLGYLQSEALVTMHKTPDNTFPIFWYESEMLRNIAPFPRRQT